MKGCFLYVDGLYGGCPEESVEAHEFLNPILERVVVLLCVQAACSPHHVGDGLVVELLRLAYLKEVLKHPLGFEFLLP